MGNKMCPYVFMVAKRYTYFISNHYNYTEKDKIEEGTLLNATNDNLDPFLYYPGKRGEDSFKKLERSQIHSCLLHDDEEDENVDLVVEDEDDVLLEEDENLIETSCCNGNNKVVKILNQKCVICYERDSDYAVRRCGH